MDNNLYEIIKMVVAALVGGGLWAIINWRIKRKKLKGDVAVAQYRQVEDIVDSFITQMGDMSDQITQLQQENMNLRNEIIMQQKDKKNEPGTTS